MAVSKAPPRALPGGRYGSVPSRSNKAGSSRRAATGQKRREFRQQVAIERSLEIDREGGKLRSLDPFPGVEFRRMRGEVDVVLAAGEAHGEPFLRLALEASAPQALLQFRREIIDVPIGALGQKQRLVGADLLFQFPPRCLER